MTPVVTTQDIDALDFSMIRQKLMDPDEGEGWNAEFTNLVAREYGRFSRTDKGLS